MKTARDPRHQHRREIVRQLYAYSFSPKLGGKKIQPVIASLDKIDKTLGKAAPEWPVEKINKIDLAVLRLALWELKIQKQVPPKVIIDEAVELAKEYGSENSPKFVNGVLGSVLSEEKDDQKDK